ncbi:MAG: biotin transporter BioY [Acholeplasmataceae bacterium]|nr:biotin transporter BioY [Acholeplasmataceae bacterium]
MNKIKQISKISLFAAFISVSVYLFPPIVVPLIQVPFTLQTLFIILAGFLFTPLEAFITVLLYVFIGAVGLPVFSGARGGLSVLLGPSGGFIMLFPLVSLFISFFKSKSKNMLHDLIIGVLISIVGLYFLANIWLSITLSLNYWVALLSLLPFIPLDIAKLLLAYFVYLKMPSEFVSRK